MNTKTSTPVPPAVEVDGNLEMTLKPNVQYATEQGGLEGDAEDERMLKELEEMQRKCPHKDFSWEDGCYDCGWYAK